MHLASSWAVSLSARKNLPFFKQTIPVRRKLPGMFEGNATLSTELEQGLRNLTLSDNEELVAAFAGQDDVYVAPDGTVHFIPDYAPENTLSEGIAGDNEYSGDELGDLTLVDALMNVGSDEFKLTPKPFNADGMDVDLAVELPSKYPYLDLTVEESSSPAAQPEVRQCGYIDLTAGEFFDRGKRKLVSLPEGHKMYVDLTLGGSLPHEITTPGSGTFEDPFDLTI
ncbi:hypothetical protein LENED_003015 [Lentinula edodes]|uniref:Uncharacterized protein n=1 Tax=Lentinula edodes TaxID=5353 RepID=A0A1Q3E2M8_LENED|nr:hypothetical protein LENED_003015 [Lentinula edodes]